MAKKKVLYFDDEPFIASSLAEDLVISGLDVTLVSKIDDVFEELKSNNYSALILDIMAPVPEKKSEHPVFSQKEINEMDRGLNTGIVLAKTIWNIENGKYKDLAILFLTAKQYPDVITHFKQNNMHCECLRKPVFAEEIIECINQL